MPVCKNESKFQNTALLLGVIHIQINFYAQKYLEKDIFKIDSSLVALSIY